MKREVPMYEPILPLVSLILFGLIGLSFVHFRGHHVTIKKAELEDRDRHDIDTLPLTRSG